MIGEATIIFLFIFSLSSGLCALVHLRRDVQRRSSQSVSERQTSRGTPQSVRSADESLKLLSPKFSIIFPRFFRAPVCTDVDKIDISSWRILVETMCKMDNSNMWRHVTWVLWIRFNRNRIYTAVYLYIIIYVQTSWNQTSWDYDFWSYILTTPVWAILGMWIHAMIGKFFGKRYPLIHVLIHTLVQIILLGYL